jgi:hypothetical protein
MPLPWARKPQCYQVTTVPGNNLLMQSAGQLHCRRTTVAVSLFFTNQRPKAATLVERDQHSAFQAEGAQQQRLDPRDGGAL